MSWSDALRAAVGRWLEDDPDPRTTRELKALLDKAAGGDTQAGDDLADRFDGVLEFGTAGLRGAMGGGPNRMNRAVVIRAAAGLVGYLKDEGGLPEPAIVIGYDARHLSDVFARDTAAVVAAAGGHAMVLPHPLPTPVLAYAIRHLGADAGVMVTASHNPAQDNGYKVYLGDGSQIVPPVDAQIAAHIAAAPGAVAVPRVDDGWETLGDEIVDDYVEAVARVVSGSAHDLSVVHTSLHGVGNDVALRAFQRAGFPVPHVVESQAAPDPDFPTVTFPNPEEPGAIDAALALARAVSPDLVVANDPDADRCAAAVFDPAVVDSALGSDGDWRMLRGDEVGALLGWRALARSQSGDGVVASSIVSSRLLAAMAQEAGVRHQETLTGFKWIARVPGLVYGYEEALGYCVAPETVRDKDGVSAALALGELAAGLKADGRTLLDLLDEIAVAHGVHATDSFSVRVDDLGDIAIVMKRLRDASPEAIAGTAVVQMDDLSRGDAGLPPTDGLRWFLADESRVIVRPSGTEPKLKVYLEVTEPVAGPETLASARRTAAARLATIRAHLELLTQP